MPPNIEAWLRARNLQGKELPRNNAVTIWSHQEVESGTNTQGSALFTSVLVFSLGVTLVFLFAAKPYSAQQVGSFCVSVT